MKYTGETVKFYVRDDLTIAEFDAEQTGDIIDDAVHKRNQIVSERLGVDFEFIEGPGGWGGREEFVRNAKNSIMANDQAYDIIGGYSMATAALAVESYLYDLNDTAYIDFSKPWWSDSLLKESTINGKLYLASGDIATSLIGYMYATFFNKQILDDFKLEDPYELALDGKWTLDKLIEMSTGVYSDLNGNGKKDAEDRLGFQLYYVYNDAIYHGAGLKLTDTGDDGFPIMSKSLTSEKAISLVEKYISFMNDTDDALSAGEDVGVATFKEGNHLFAVQEVQTAITKFRDVKFDYGILPIPKYDEEQENYSTLTSFPYTLYGIPIDARNADMSSAVLELLSAEGYKTVSPAYFEIALKVKYTSDDNASKVYDIIKGSISYDFGRVYSDSIKGSPVFAFRGAVNENNTNWMSKMDSIKSSYEAGLESIKENFTDAE